MKRYTPPVYHPNRTHYERFSSGGNDINRLMLEVDYAIETMQQAISSGNNIDSVQIAEFNAHLEHATQVGTSNADSNFTDIHRLAAAVVFARDRVLMPFLFGSNTRRIKEHRRNMADGYLGMSTDGIGDFLTIHDVVENSREVDDSGILDHIAQVTGTSIGFATDALKAKFKGKEDQNLRGCIQEQTAQALFNYDQDPDFVVLPVSYREDTKLGIDLMAYFIGYDGAGYMQPISIKSSPTDAAAAKLRDPEYVVLSSEDFMNNNAHMNISRLLVREQAGHPGLSATEKAKLEDATTAIHDEFRRQVAVIPGTKVPNQRAQHVLRQVQLLVA